jgi:hypothetical protein
MRQPVANSGPPRLILGTSAFVVVVGVVLIFAGGWRIGMSWDESYHVVRMRTYLDHGWFLLGSQTQDGRPVEGVTDQYVYGPVTMWLLHGLGVIAGVESPGGISATATAYAVRHLGIGAIGVAGTLAVSGLCRLITGSWGWALYGAAICLATPAWTGHSMMNPKDVSVATGYTIFTLGLAWIARTSRGERARAKALGPVLIAGGTILALGTRPGIWAGLASSSIAFVVLVSLMDRADEKVSGGIRIHWRWRELALGIFVAAAFLVLIYPEVFLKSFGWISLSASSSSNFYVDSHGFWFYVPLYYVTTVPLLMIFAGAIGIGHGLGTLLRERLAPSVRTVRTALVGVQALVLPAAAMILVSDLNDGLRQLLFLFPAMAVLTVVGTIGLLNAQSTGSGVVYRAIVSGLVAVGIAVPMVDQVRLFPYSYAYFNEVPTLLSVDVPTDTWWTSTKELARYLPPDTYVACARVTTSSGDLMPYATVGHNDCSRNKAGTLAPYDGLRAGVLSTPLRDTEFLAVVTGLIEVPPNCDVLDRVERGLRGSRVVMGYVARCVYPLPEYSGGTRSLRMDASLEDPDPAVLDGWQPARSGPGITPNEQSARLGFTLNSALVGKRLILRMNHSGPPIAVQANGVTLTPSSAGGTTFWVPASASLANADGAFVITVGTGPDRDEIALTGVELERSR